MNRWFPVTEDGMRTIARAVATQVGNSFKDNGLSYDWVRSFRARNRDLAFRPIERVDATVFAARDQAHLLTYKDRLLEVAEDHPGILEDPTRIWNMDETEVSGEVCTKRRAFARADGNSGAGRQSVTYNDGKHLTAFIIANANGDILPPLYLFQGVQQMRRWFESLPENAFGNSDNPANYLCEPDWLPDNAVVFGTEKGSQVMTSLSLVIEHLHRFRKPLLSDKTGAMLLLLDGHPSPNGFQWLERAVETNIVVVQAPANTSSFLQPCDNLIKKTFKSSIRSTIDSLDGCNLYNMSDLAMKLKLATVGYNALTAEVVKKAFQNTVIWPMDFRFLETFGIESTVNQSASAANPTVENSVCKDLFDILSDKELKGREVDTLVSRLIDMEDASEIVLNLTEGCAEIAMKREQDASRAVFYKRVVSPGKPALYLTHKDIKEQRLRAREEAAHKRAKKLTKDNRRREKQNVSKTFTESGVRNARST